MPKPRKTKRPEELTDEEVLHEFVRRYRCQGAILIYLDDGIEYWFGRWRDRKGQAWLADFIATMCRHLEPGGSPEGTSAPPLYNSDQ